MGISQEGERRPKDLMAIFNRLKTGISMGLSFPDLDSEDRQNFQNAKLVAKEKSGELRSNNPEQNFDRIEHVRVGNAHVIYSRDGIEKSDIEGR